MIDILRTMATKYEWVNWLVSDQGIVADEMRQLLETAFGNLSKQAQRKTLQTLRNADESRVEAAVYEILAHELLFRLKLSPTFEPYINNLTPDIMIKTEKGVFIADVFVTHTPERAIKESETERLTTGPYAVKKYDPDERSIKIAEELKKKAGRYAVLNIPLLLFVFRTDDDVVRISDVERALFGMRINEFIKTGVSLLDIDDGQRYDSVFLSHIYGQAKFSNISAVIDCQWFATLNKTKPGMRLQCTIFHHWKPDVSLPLEAFANFVQIMWSERENGIWAIDIKGNSNVARLSGEKSIDFGVYTADNPW